MWTIDGRRGEGGGQVLRTTLTLSALTGTPVRLTDIRGGRPKGGLLRQHLTAVRAAAACCGAQVEGADVGSQALVFWPGPLRAVDLDLDIGSAGATTLVLQTALPLLLAAPGPCSLVVRGGTHNTAAPSYHHVEQAFLPALRRMGADVDLTLRAWGFYPAGGGELSLSVRPGPLQPLHLGPRGEVTLSATAVVSALADDIARRQAAVVQRGLSLRDEAVRVQHAPRPRGPGNVVWITAASEEHHELFTAFGARGVSAEAVAKDALRQARAWLGSGATVGPHTADQLLLPMALAGGGSFTVSGVTEHTRTNAGLIEELLGVPVRIEDGRVVVGDAG